MEERKDGGREGGSHLVGVGGAKKVTEIAEQAVGP